MIQQQSVITLSVLQVLTHKNCCRIRLCCAQRNTHKDTFTVGKSWDRLPFILELYTFFKVISHMTDLGTPTQGPGSLHFLNWCIQVTQQYSREHFIMNLWDAPSSCSRHTCPASYSGSYLNNWFQNLKSQCCESHAYQQVEERFFNRACSMHGNGKWIFYELEKHEKLQTVSWEISLCDKGDG